LTAPLRVFITGASSGLGAALADHYGAMGASLGLVGRRAEALLQTAAGFDARTYVADVRDAAAMQSAAQAFLDEVGAPDIVIAAAGISVGTLTEEETDHAVFRAVMDANVLGLVHTFHPFIAAMQARGGVLCGISSVAGVRGLPGGGAYSASKAAASNYLEALRLELKSRSIAVVTVFARLHRYADDPGQPLPDAVQNAGAGRSRQGGPLHRSAPPPHRHSVANVHRRNADEMAAGFGL
jgi:NADP-dependent 3-hydroxy acid dehydrogenase YdfG